MSKIKVVEEILGTHFWNGADSIPTVSFLKHEHHHNFQIVVKAEVEHDDRDIEFIDLRIKLKQYFYEVKEYPVRDWIVRFGSSSCEMIALNIQYYLESIYGNKKFTVSVFEDNIQGGGQW